ncbi:MAG TPA: hypothetical protein VNO34_09775, partial [Actinomycetota bacterium]|nr:hypothetical protein [Actinomycetota bacterium]
GPTAGTGSAPGRPRPAATPGGSPPSSGWPSAPWRWFHEEGPRRIARKLSHPPCGGYRVSPAGVYRCLRRFGLSTRLEAPGDSEARSLAQVGLNSRAGL